MSEGSPTAFINGKPAGRRGDGIDCGGVAQSGSGNVFMDENGMRATIIAPFVGGTECQIARAQQASPAMRG